MKLHSAYPYWMISGGLERSYPVLRDDARADVAVIGAGITGALVSHALSSAGLDVIVVDKRHVAHGSTSASTALLQYEMDTPLFLLARRFGDSVARRAYSLCSEALEQLAALGGEIGDADFTACPSLWYATYRKHVAEILEPEFAARRAAGFDVRLLDEAEVHDKFGFSAPAAILSRQAGQVNPYRLTQVLFERFAAAGGRVYESTEVREVAPSARRVRLRTQHGATIDAQYVVVAAGYEAQPFLPLHVGTTHSTYAIISKQLAEQEPWYGNAVLWETRVPYHYFRTTRDRRIIVGGRDDRFQSAARRDAALRQKSRALQADFHKLFPHIPFEMDFWWGGTFTDTKDGLPYIGPCGHKRVLYALGYGGNGTTFSMVAANLLRDRILGVKNPDADIFGFDRTSAVAMPDGDVGAAGAAMDAP